MVNAVNTCMNKKENKQVVFTHNTTVTMCTGAIKGNTCNVPNFTCTNLSL